MVDNMIRKEDMIIAADIIPTSINIFYEDGIPYIKYIGTTYLDNGTKVEVEFPKMDLCLRNITQETNYEYQERKGIRIPIKYERNIFTVEDNWMYVRTLERKVSKEQLEKELGYKLIFEENERVTNEIPRNTTERC